MWIPPQTQKVPPQASGINMCNKGTNLVQEIFAGTCRLSQACRGLSLQELSGDKDVDKAENAVVAKYDLCNANHFAPFWSGLVKAERHQLVHAHFVPSCGAVSTTGRGRCMGCHHMGSLGHCEQTRNRMNWTVGMKRRQRAWMLQTNLTMLQWILF